MDGWMIHTYLKNSMLSGATTTTAARYVCICVLYEKSERDVLLFSFFFVLLKCPPRSDMTERNERVRFKG